MRRWHGLNPIARPPSAPRRGSVSHRRLKVRGAGSTEWAEFSGTAETRPLLGGLCNVEENRFEGQDSSGGVAIRCFDRSAKRWSIYWVGSGGTLQPPVHGGFNGGVGSFEGGDVDGDRPIIARFLWHKITPDSARWEQSFSYDGGDSWETNWTMDFKRVPPNNS